MRWFAASVVIISAFSSSLWAQERDLSRERISLALQQPPRARTLVQPGGDAKLGPFTLRTPELRGEIIRLSLPVGEYASRIARGMASASRRRQEASARRTIAEELKMMTSGHTR